MTSDVAEPLSVASAGFWSHYWVTLRPYLFFVSGSAGWVGLALAPKVDGVALVLAGMAFFFTYGLGQALTDVTQTDTDALSAPYRPLVRGEISKTAVAGVSLAGLVACAVIFGALNPWTLGVSALAVFGLATYTPLKRRWWGGPLWNSWIIALLPLIGWLCQGGRPWDLWQHGQVMAAMGSTFGTYATFVILGYFKDIEADRATGYDTVVVHFGRRVGVAVSAAFLVFGMACSWFLIGPHLYASVPGLALWGAGALALVSGHLRTLPLTRDDQAGPVLVVVVIGFVLFHLGEAVLLRPAWIGWTSVVAVAAAFALLRRPSRGQV